MFLYSRGMLAHVGWLLHLVIADGNSSYRVFAALQRYWRRLLDNMVALARAAGSPSRAQEGARRDHAKAKTARR